MSVAANADDYANARIGIFFTANNETPDDGNLTGQCVTLVKWFMSEMSEVPRPFAARGDARYVGKTLVAQGHADEVPYAARQAGDIICMEYGTYGHIYVQLENGRIFEQNVSWPGVASRLVDGSRVYASRIGSDSESWRHDLHAYRLKTYSGGDIPMFNEGDRVNVNNYLYGKDLGRFKWCVGKDWKTAMYYGIFETKEYKTDSKFNEGDIPQLQAALGTKDAAGQVGKPWKNVYSEYILANMPTSDYEPINEQLFRKKG